MSRFISVITLALMICIFPSAEESSSGVEKAYVVEIHGEIDRAMMVFIRRGIGQAKTGGAAAMIFDIDTFGGRVDSALQITSLIGSVDSIPTIAFVPATPEGTGVSWSAGALISFSCSRIYMAPGTSIGAAAPVYQTQEGMDMAPEKVVSALRTQMAALAEKNGYPKGIALAMVDKDVELWEAYLGENLLILTPQEFELEEKKAASEGKKLQKGKPIIQSGKLLALTAGEMLTYGVSSGTVPDLATLLADLGLAHAKPVYLHQNVPDRIVTVLTSSAVTSLLVIIGLIALFMEVTSPGFGIPGTTAIVCFSILFVSHFLLGTVGSLELLIFLCGVVLLILEIFIIPGFGVTGITGILLIMLSLVLAMQDFVWPVFDWQWDILKRNLLLVFLSLIASFLIMLSLARFLPRISPLRKLMLTSAQSASDGYSAQDRDMEQHLIGKQGIAVTKLRPVGKAEIEGRVLVVEAEGEFIEPGSRLEIVELSGNRIVVRGC